MLSRSFNGEVTILTPYKSQLVTLTKMGVDAQIVDSIQGCEFLNGIFSVGRTEGIGFLNDRRLNVALSRCSGITIIISHRSVVNKSKTLTRIMNTTKVNNSLCSLNTNFVDC